VLQQFSVRPCIFKGVAQDRESLPVQVPARHVPVFIRSLGQRDHSTPQQWVGGSCLKRLVEDVPKNNALERRFSLLDSRITIRVPTCMQDDRLDNQVCIARSRRRVVISCQAGHRHDHLLMQTLA
jgi:hypothetical protein